MLNLKNPSPAVEEKHPYYFLLKNQSSATTITIPAKAIQTIGDGPELSLPMEPPALSAADDAEAIIF
jgi:hypothetical protein